MKTLMKTTMASGIAAIVVIGGAASASPTVGSYSTVLAANLNVADLVSVGIGPIALASGFAPGPYASNKTLASLITSGSLGLGALDTTTGVIVDTAASNYPPTLSGTATSTVNGLDTNLNLLILGSLLDVSATTLTSTSTASDFSGLVFTGSSEINNLHISGSALGPDIFVNVSGLAATPVNDILLNRGDLAIVSNLQTPIYSGSNIIGIQTTALAIGFNNFAYGTGLLSGEILIADSAAAIAGVPEPATWAMMLTGFGILGAVARRRRGSAPATA